MTRMMDEVLSRRRSNDNNDATKDLTLGVSMVVGFSTLLVLAGIVGGVCLYKIRRKQRESTPEAPPSSAAFSIRFKGQHDWKRASSGNVPVEPPGHGGGGGVCTGAAAGSGSIYKIKSIPDMPGENHMDSKKMWASLPDGSSQRSRPVPVTRRKTSGQSAVAHSSETKRLAKSASCVTPVRDSCIPPAPVGLPPIDTESTVREQLHSEEGREMSRNDSERALARSSQLLTRRVSAISSISIGYDGVTSIDSVASSEVSPIDTQPNLEPPLSKESGSGKTESTRHDLDHSENAYSEPQSENDMSRSGSRVIGSENAYYSQPQSENGMSRSASRVLRSENAYYSQPQSENGMSRSASRVLGSENAYYSQPQSENGMSRSGSRTVVPSKSLSDCGDSGSKSYQDENEEAYYSRPQSENGMSRAVSRQQLSDEQSLGIYYEDATIMDPPDVSAMKNAMMNERATRIAASPRAAPARGSPHATRSNGTRAAVARNDDNGHDVLPVIAMDDPLLLLEQLGLGDYREIFAEAKMIDTQILLSLTDRDLAQLKLPLGARKRYKKALVARGGTDIYSFL